MKQRILLIVAVLLIATPAFAVVSINLAQGTGADVNKVTVSYSTTGEAVRAFALDFTLGSSSNSMTWSNIADFNRGESNKVGGGYGIFPGQFRNSINPADPNWFAQYYYPAAPPNDVDSNGTGMGERKFIAELGTLYKDANAPGTSGTLFTVRVDANGQTGCCPLAVVVNTVRGGVVLEDGNSVMPTINNLPSNEICLSVPCTVPNVVNVLEAPIMTTGPNAVGMILAAGLTLGTRTTGPSTTITAGKVTSTNPAALASVVCNSPVDYNVSTGPATCATCVGDWNLNGHKATNDWNQIRSKLISAYGRTGYLQVDKGSATTGDLWNVCGDNDATPNLKITTSDWNRLRSQLISCYNSTGYLDCVCP